MSRITCLGVLLALAGLVSSESAGAQTMQGLGFLPGATYSDSNAKGVSADGSTTSRNSSSQSSAAGPAGTSSFSQSGNDTTTQSCLAHGWQNITKGVSVWLSEKRCDGFACDIGENTFRWKRFELNRYTGQMRDGCYIYECQKSTGQQRF